MEKKVYPSAIRACRTRRGSKAATRVKWACSPQLRGSAVVGACNGHWALGVMLQCYATCCRFAAHRSRSVSQKTHLRVTSVIFEENISEFRQFGCSPQLSPPAEHYVGARSDMVTTLRAIGRVFLHGHRLDDKDRRCVVPRRDECDGRRVVGRQAAGKDPHADARRLLPERLYPEVGACDAVEELQRR